ncbi:hypothetical protein B0T25DRAFT_550569 [Lasiosphaeria hispida]|uniref:Uncharacterized protein n=1 Tax=Lasiosphaeria hispida TaxID=260671 RepID=A0AAJ0MA44_9PEZI|nr:hypothetical protein B0T25DRAFT_550569 [Lasiosphaeria hispida]
MSSETTPAKDSPVDLKEATSKKGEKYQASNVSNDSEISINKAGFSVDVNWPPTEEWVYLSQDLVNKTHITRYKLERVPPPPVEGGLYFEWGFWFTNTDTYDFFFEDKTHDEYENNTYLKKDHVTTYNSVDPTIIRVRGT